MFKKLVYSILIMSLSFSCCQGKFLLLLGPSGTGKSTIIQHLKKMDNRFEYVTPLTTRELRPGEQDKIHVSIEEIEILRNADKLLTVNMIYGTYYATPKYIIETALIEKRFPVLDWPIDKINIMQEFYGNQIYTVYIEPDDINELERRLSIDSRDKNGERYQAGKLEIDNLLAGKYDSLINLRIVNKKGCCLEVTQEIYQAFLGSLEI